MDFKEINEHPVVIFLLYLRHIIQKGSTWYYAIQQITRLASQSMLLRDFTVHLKETVDSLKQRP